jgi:diguanylate cyclase (GGDEF)-like protein
MAGMLSVMRRGYPRSIRGLNLWAISFVLGFVGALLIGAHGKIPDAFTTILGNCAILYSATLSYWGSQQFYQQPTTHKFWALGVAMCAPVFAWLTFINPNYPLRVQVFSLMMVSILMAHTALLRRSAAVNYFARVAAVVMAIQIFFLLLRTVTLGMDNAIQGVFDPSVMQVVHLMAYAFAGLLLTVSQVLMASERMRMEFEHVATHDHLTGALSRGAFIDVCAQELERCQRHSRVLSLMMMDLDHFKLINDTHGHLVGDRVLMDFVKQASYQLRRPDRLGRFGGEEFVLLLPDTPLEDAGLVAERIRERIQKANVDPACTVSIGITTSAGKKEDVDQLIARADVALYRAKNKGRNCVELEPVV